MKTVLFCLVMTVIYNPAPNTTTQHVPIQDLAPSDSLHLINFETQVEPIFVGHCSPCHFTGGKMYSKLPFDKGDTIIAHEAGILRRIKDEKETLIIKEFVEQRKGKY